MYVNIWILYRYLLVFMIFYYKCFFYLVLSIFDFFLGVDVGFFFVLFVGVYCVGNDFLFEKKMVNMIFI